MARGINRVTLIGNLGRDPEVRTTQDQFVIANITLATSSAWKDRSTGQLQERTEWHRVVFFGRLGEIVRDYLKKGSKIYVEGRLQTRKWTDQQGADRYTTEIIANEMQMLDSRGSREGSFQAPAPAQSAALPQQQPATPSNVPSSTSDTFDDDDIPF